MTLAGTAEQHFETLDIEVVKVWVDRPTTYDYISKLSEIYSVNFTPATAMLVAGGSSALQPYCTVSGRTISFELGSTAGTAIPLFVVIHGKK